jgi:hypothetical protein
MNRRMHGAGLAMSAIVVLAMLADGIMQLLGGDALRELMKETGWPYALAPVLGGVSIFCALVYALPRTSTLGAILITGFFGGAIATHVRMGEFGSAPVVISLLVGLLAWAGLWFRDPRISAILPLRT